MENNKVVKNSGIGKINELLGDKSPFNSNADIQYFLPDGTNIWYDKIKFGLNPNFKSKHLKGDCFEHTWSSDGSRIRAISSTIIVEEDNWTIRIFYIEDSSWKMNSLSKYELKLLDKKLRFQIVDETVSLHIEGERGIRLFPTQSVEAILKKFLITEEREVFYL